MAKLKKEIEHKDIFGKIIAVGDVVIMPGNNFTTRLTVGTVKKLNPKMINMIELNKTRVVRYYPEEVLVVTDDPRVTAYMLLSSGKPKMARR